jgi:hypothetical protein
VFVTTKDSKLRVLNIYCPRGKELDSKIYVNSIKAAEDR